METDKLHYGTPADVYFEIQTSNKPDASAFDFRPPSQRQRWMLMARFIQ